MEAFHPYKEGDQRLMKVLVCSGRKMDSMEFLLSEGEDHVHVRKGSSCNHTHALH